MSIEAYWLIQDRIVLLQNKGSISIEELAASDATINAMIASSPHDMVHILIDDREQTAMPSLNHMARLKYLRHPHLGWIISQQTHPVARMIGSVVGSIAKLRFRFVTTLYEGCDYLTLVDSSLPSGEEIYEHLKAIESANPPTQTG